MVYGKLLENMPQSYGQGRRRVLHKCLDKLQDSHFTGFLEAN